MPSFRVLVTGATGFLGPFVAAELRQRGHDVVCSGRSGGDVRADLTRRGVLGEVLRAVAADAVIHLAAMARIGDCALHPELAAATNAALPGAMAQQLGARLLLVSTDLVFDGRAGPYGSDAVPAPLSVYGASKLAGEEQALQHGARVVRLPLLFGPDARGRGATASIRRALAGGQPVTLFTNEYRTPLHALDAARALCELALLPGGPQLLHVAGGERLSRWQFGQRFCAAHGLPAERLQPGECSDPQRPRDVSLISDWPPLRDLEAMLQDG